MNIPRMIEHDDALLVFWQVARQRIPTAHLVGNRAARRVDRKDVKVAHGCRYFVPCERCKIAIKALIGGEGAQVGVRVVIGNDGHLNPFSSKGNGSFNRGSITMTRPGERVYMGITANPSGRLHLPREEEFLEVVIAWFECDSQGVDTVLKSARSVNSI